MAKKRFRLVARVSSSNPRAVKPVLEQSIDRSSLKEKYGEFIIEAEIEGESAKELNRLFLSSLRRIEKITRLHAEWTSLNGTTEKFFD
jgi:hypothetical protein